MAKSNRRVYTVKFFRSEEDEHYAPEGGEPGKAQLAKEIQAAMDEFGGFTSERFEVVAVEDVAA